MANNNRLSDMARGATEVNLRFTASLLNLSKDYLKAISEAVTKEFTNADSDTDATGDAGQRTVPLVIAGRRGDLANAAFSVSNSSKTDGAVAVVIQGEFGKTQVTVEPDELVLKSGESTTVRILAKIDESLSIDEDKHGSIVLPELDLQVVEFVVRRLPELPVKKKKRKRKSSKK